MNQFRDQFVSSEVPQWVMLRGVVYPGHEKAPFVPSGKSVRGCVAYKQSDDTLQCHECGHWKASLASHIRRAHPEISVREYKYRHGLRQSTRLIGRRLQASLSASARELRGAGLNDVRRKNCLNNLAKARLVVAARGRSTDELRNEQGSCNAQLIERLSRLVKELGRTPSSTELLSAGLHFRSILDSFNVRTIAELMDRLGFGVYRSRIDRMSDDALLDTIRDFYVSRNRLPKYSEFSKGGIPSRGSFIRRFGSMEETFNRAGLGLIANGRNGRVYTDEYIFEKLRSFISSTNRVPKTSEFRSDRLPFTSASLRNRYGSTIHALISAGIDLVGLDCRRLHGGWLGLANQTKKSVRDKLLAYMEEHAGDLPTTEMIRSGFFGASPSQLIRLFGTSNRKKLASLISSKAA